jgi:hypothetical protein
MAAADVVFGMDESSGDDLEQTADADARGEGEDDSSHSSDDNFIAKSGEEDEGEGEGGDDAADEEEEDADEEDDPSDPSKDMPLDLPTKDAKKQRKELAVRKVVEIFRRPALAAASAANASRPVAYLKGVTRVMVEDYADGCVMAAVSPLSYLHRPPNQDKIHKIICGRLYPEMLAFLVPEIIRDYENATTSAWREVPSQRCSVTNRQATRCVRLDLEMPDGVKKNYVVDESLMALYVATVSAKFFDREIMSKAITWLRANCADLVAKKPKIKQVVEAVTRSVDECKHDHVVKALENIGRVAAQHKIAI